MATGNKTQDSKPSLDLPTEIPYDFLRSITNDFSKDRRISGNPFGTLYRGNLPDDGRVIAVKKLQENAAMPANKSFKMEVHNVMALKHENIVQIIGYCNETSKKFVQLNGKYIQADINESLICYEYLPKGNLEDSLFGPLAGKVISSTEPGIEWATRFKIIKGICQGLHFLHKLDIPIIHMDLKPENIFLNEKMVPKIADFALSRVFGEEQTRLCTQKVVGSYGYMAPEYLHMGEISAQSDIYSLGVMIIEITTGEKNRPEKDQPSARSFIDKVCQDWTLERIADRYGSSDTEVLRQVKTCIEVGSKCVAIDRRDRPAIDKIVAALNGLHGIQIENKASSASSTSMNKKFGSI